MSAFCFFCFFLQNEYHGIMSKVGEVTLIKEEEILYIHYRNCGILLQINTSFQN